MDLREQHARHLMAAGFGMPPEVAATAWPLLPEAIRAVWIAAAAESIAIIRHAADDARMDELCRLVERAHRKTTPA